jgi:hypothetical protein
MLEVCPTTDAVRLAQRSAPRGDAFPAGRSGCADPAAATRVFPGCTRTMGIAQNPRIE